MMTIKFLHCADLHIDSPMLGLERYEGAPVEDMRGATRRALENLVRLAGEEKVDFVVIAGDLFDGAWQDVNTGLFFARQMRYLKEHDIEVYVVRGNHDAQSRFCREIPYPDNVHIFNSDNPQTLDIDGLGVAVHGQSFMQPAVTEDLAARYPEPLSGYFNIGILHTALDGRTGHGNYAPCTVAALQNKGYQYWALGHVHAREVVCADNPCCIVFPGNIQGRHIREWGSKGCQLVTVAQNGAITMEHRALDVARWMQLELDVTGTADACEIHERLRSSLGDVLQQADDRIVALRLILRGPCRAHRTLRERPESTYASLRSLVMDASAERAWVERIQLDTRPVVDMVELLARSDPLGELVRLVHDKQEDQLELVRYAQDEGGLRDLMDRLPHELKEGADPLRFDDPTVLHRFLGEAQNTLLAQLMAQEPDQ